MSSRNTIYMSLTPSAWLKFSHCNISQQKCLSDIHLIPSGIISCTGHTQRALCSAPRSLLLAIVILSSSTLSSLDSSPVCRRPPVPCDKHGNLWQPLVFLCLLSSLVQNYSSRVSSITALSCFVLAEDYLGSLFFPFLHDEKWGPPLLN